MTNHAPATAAVDPTEVALYQPVRVTTRYGIVTGLFAGNVKDRGAHHVLIDGDDGIKHTYAAHLVTIEVTR